MTGSPMCGQQCSTNQHTENDLNQDPRSEDSVAGVLAIGEMTTRLRSSVMLPPRERERGWEVRVSQVYRIFRKKSQEILNSRVFFDSSPLYF